MQPAAPVPAPLPDAPMARDSRGFRFKDNKLYAFGAAGQVMLIESWPTLRALVKRSGEPGWRSFEPAFRIVRPYRRARRRQKPLAETPQLDLGILAEVPAVATKRRLG